MLKVNLLDNMRKTTLLFLFQVLCLTVGFGQIELENSNVLFIGYDNRLTVSESVLLEFPKSSKRQNISNDNDSLNEIITSEFYENEIDVKENINGVLDGFEITNIGFTGEYKIVPDASYFEDGDSLTIEFYSRNDGVFISKRTYILRNLPLANIYLGILDINSDQQVSRKDLMHMRVLHAKYPPEIPINISFVIASYTITIGDKKFTGIGSEWSDEVRMALRQLKNVTNTNIIVTVVYYSEYDQLFQVTKKCKLSL